MYAMRHTLSTRVQLYFQRPLETFLNAPYCHRQRWLIITWLATAQQQLPVTGQSQLTSYNFSISPEFISDRQHGDPHPNKPSLNEHSNKHASHNTQTTLTKFFKPTPIR
jgi:hypothetical protein